LFCTFIPFWVLHVKFGWALETAKRGSWIVVVIVIVSRGWSDGSADRES
jgi:hypothetical protein